MDDQTELTTRPTNPADILDCAADLIEEKGLARGTYYDLDKGSYCVLGAIYKCATGNPYDVANNVRATTANFLRDHIGSGLITSWNDNPNRRPSTIVRTLRRVAAKYRAAHPEEA